MEPDKKACSTCFEPIAALATKCTHCDSYQDWRRHLSIGSSVLALLVALVSVIALSAPGLVTLATPKNSKIEIRLQGMEDDKLYFVAANRGVRPGSVSSVAYSIARPDRKETASRLQFTPVMIEPGRGLQLIVPLAEEERTHIDSEVWTALSSKNRDAFQLTIEVWLLDFDGDERTIELPISINQLFRSGPARWHYCFLQEYLTENDRVRVDAPLPTQDDVRKVCGVPGTVEVPPAKTSAGLGAGNPR